MRSILALLVLVIACTFSPETAFAQEMGKASYYADGLTGRKMANGVRYNPEEFTCAHRSLPFGTILKVSRKDRPEHTVMVTVSDRGPFVKGRVVDLSKRAARELNIINKGIAEVVVSVIKLPEEDDEPVISGL